MATSDIQNSNTKIYVVGSTTWIRMDRIKTSPISANLPLVNTWVLEAGEHRILNFSTNNVCAGSTNTAREHPGERSLAWQ